MTRPMDIRDATIALMDADPSLDFATAEAAALERAADARDAGLWPDCRASATPLPAGVGE